MAVVIEGGDDDVERFTLSSVVEGVIRVKQLCSFEVDVVALKSMVET